MGHAHDYRTAQIVVRPKVFSMTFSPTGRFIAAAGTDGQVDFVSTAKRKVVKQRQTNAGARVHAIAYIPNKTEDLIVGDEKRSYVCGRWFLARKNSSQMLTHWKFWR